MADITMDVRELTRITGVIDWVLDAKTKAGDAANPGGVFLFPNDGQTFLLIYSNGAAAGETLTFTGKANKYGRVSADLNFQVASTKTGLCGPFSPALWNDNNGMVTFTLTEKHNNTKILAVRITNSQRNGV